MRVQHVVPCQGRYAVRSAIAVAAIGVPGIGHFTESPHGKVGRILRVRRQARQDLAPDPFDRILIKAGLDHRRTQQVNRLIPVLGQKPRRNSNRILPGRKAELRRQRIARFGKALCIQRACPFFQCCRHQVHRAA